MSTQEPKKNNQVQHVAATAFELERAVPVSETEILACHFQADGSIVLELGYMKNKEKKQGIIDVRKRLNPTLTKDLYDRLKEVFDKKDSNK